MDYYHASQRIWKMAEALFGQGPRTTSWARKMQKLLKKPGGVNRVLHSAANLRALQRLGGTRLRDFKKALSGMGWREPGAQTILNLRVLQLSGVWQPAYERVLSQFEEAQVPGQPYAAAREAKKAA